MQKAYASLCRRRSVRATEGAEFRDLVDRLAVYRRAWAHARLSNCRRCAVRRCAGREGCKLHWPPQEWQLEWRCDSQQRQQISAFHCRLAAHDEGRRSCGSGCRQRVSGCVSPSYIITVNVMSLADFLLQYRARRSPGTRGSSVNISVYLYPRLYLSLRL